MLTAVKVKTMAQYMQLDMEAPDFREELRADIEEFKVVAIGEGAQALRSALHQVDPNWARWESSPGVGK